MGLRIIELFDDAAADIADPSRTRIKDDSVWLGLYNRSVRDVCERHPVYIVIDDFDLQAMGGEMAWPDNMVQCQGIQVSDTPEIEDTFRWLGEMNEQRFRASTQQRYPNQTVPEWYCPQSLRYWFYPMPTSFIYNGARITYSAVPEKAANPTLEDFPLPWFLRDYVIQRMAYYAHRKLNEYEEAAENERGWNERFADIREKIEDRSDDARPRMRAATQSDLVRRSW